MTSARILVVEDEAIIAKSVQNKLIRMGYDVPAIAHTGRQAIQKASEMLPDLILMDIRLKGDIDGVEAAERIRDQIGISVIYLTAFSDEDTLARAKITTPMGYLLKPVQDRELGITIEMALYRNKMEKLVSESEARFSSFFESAPEVIFVLDSQGMIMQANTMAKKRLEYSSNELAGRPLTKFVTISSQEHFADKLPSFSKEGVNRLELEMLRKDGTIVDMDCSIGALSNRQSKELCFVMYLRDITERKRIERAIAEKTEELLLTQAEIQSLSLTIDEKAEQELKGMGKLLTRKDEFISQLGHDLKNPLTPVMALVPMLQQRESDPTSKELLEVVTQNLDYMRNLIDKTVQLARVNSDNVALFIEKINLSEEVDRLIQTKQWFYSNYHVNTENRIDSSIAVAADRIQLIEVLENLTSNAVKFMADGGTVFFDARTDDEYVTISVKDTGIGLVEGQTECIFDEFYKADSTGHCVGSSGLGLTISKRIIERHGGKIWAESDGPGKGTTIRFSQPKQPQHSSQPVSDGCLSDEMVTEEA